MGKTETINFLSHCLHIYDMIWWRGSCC